MRRIQNNLLILFVSLILLVVSIHTIAQTPFIFIPSVKDDAALKTLAAITEKRYHDETASLSKENQKDYLAIYKSVWEDVKQKFDKKEIYTADNAQQYLNAIVAEIKSKNPVLQSASFNCFFSCSGVPNAAYLGDGIIIFHMGLFNKLENESQAAFVICHEISHFYLHHMENSISKQVTLLNSDDVQKQLLKVKNAEFKKREMLEKLVTGITFNSMKHSRDHEGQADSMAVEFMRNTRFDIAESLTALSMLDKIDDDNFETNLFLQQAFNAKEYPFQKKWITKDEGLLGGSATVEVDKVLADSLKTHPDCMLRVKMLEPMVKQYKASATKNIINKSTFDELKKSFNYEIIEYAYSSGNYTLSLYYTLKLLQQNADDPYLLTQVGKIFNGFYSAQKSHTLSKLIDLPAPHFSSNYNGLLQFIQNLYVNDYAQISFNFLKQYNSSLSYYKPFQAVFNTSTQISK